MIFAGSGYMKKVKDPDPGSDLVVTIFNNKCKTDGKIYID